MWQCITTVLCFQKTIENYSNFNAKSTVLTLLLVSLLFHSESMTFLMIQHTESNHFIRPSELSRIFAARLYHLYTMTQRPSAEPFLFSSPPLLSNNRQITSITAPSLLILDNLAGVYSCPPQLQQRNSYMFSNKMESVYVYIFPFCKRQFFCFQGLCRIFICIYNVFRVMYLSFLLSCIYSFVIYISLCHGICFLLFPPGRCFRGNCLFFIWSALFPPYVQFV